MSIRNRAKCKICKSVIESYHAQDLVMCECGEIGVDGGDALRCLAKDFSNFMRVDDDGNEIKVKVKEKVEDSLITIDKTLQRDWDAADRGEGKSLAPMSREDLLFTLESMAYNIENLPQAAMLEPITHADFCSLLLVLSALFRLDNSSK